MEKTEREKRGYGAVSYMQIVFIVYDDFFHPAPSPSLLFLFIEIAALIRSRKKKENH